MEHHHLPRRIFLPTCTHVHIRNHADQANLPPTKKKDQANLPPRKKTVSDFQERLCNTHSLYWPYDMHSVQWTCTSSPPPPLLGVSSEPSSESSQRPPAEKAMIANFKKVIAAKFWPHRITGKSSSQARHKRSNKMQCWTLCKTFKPWLLRFVRYSRL